MILILHAKDLTLDDVGLSRLGYDASRRGDAKPRTGVTP